jgi:hypothetical protein
MLTAFFNNLDIVLTPPEILKVDETGITTNNNGLRLPLLGLTWKIKSIIV